MALGIPDAAHHLTIQYVPHESVYPDPHQPRLHPDAELRAAIASEGILQPVNVRPHPERMGDWMLLDGERRWRAAQGVMATIPVIVREDLELDARRLMLQLTANTAKPLTPVEQARAYARLVQLGMSTTEAAQSLGVSTSTFNERLRLLELGPWLAVIEGGQLPLTHAVEHLLPIRSIPDDVHAQILDKGRERIVPGMSSRDFGSLLREVARPLFYPLAKTKGYGKQPEFNTAKHDVECSCGAPAFELDWNSKRKCCGNPAWWRPLHRAALAKKKKASAIDKSKAGRSRTPTWAKLPEGASVRTAQYFEAKKGEMRLVENGKWDFRSEPFDPPTLLAALTPASLRRVEITGRGYGPDATCIVTTDEAAVTAARAAFTERQLTVLSETRATRRATLLADAGKPEYFIQGAGAALMLGALAHQLEYRHQSRFVDCLLALEVGAPPLEADRYGNRDLRPLMTWLMNRSADQACTILSAWLAELDCKVSITKLIEQQVAKEIARVSKTPIKWLTAAASAKPTPTKRTAPAKKESPLGRYKNGDPKDTPAKRVARKQRAEQLDIEAEIDTRDDEAPDDEDLDRDELDESPADGDDGLWSDDDDDDAETEERS